MGAGDTNPDEFDYILQETDHEYLSDQKSPDAWYFSIEQLDRVDSVVSYERNIDEGPYEELIFSLPTRSGRDPSEVSLTFDELGIVLKHDTNIDSDPILQVIKEEFPVQEYDDLFIENERYIEMVESARDVTGEVYSVELYNWNPGFNLKWNNMANKKERDMNAPFSFELRYNDFQPSIRNEIMDPLATFMPVVLRSDIAIKDVGRFIRDLTRVIDMPSKTGEPLTRFMTNEELGKLADRAAKGYDTFR